MNTGSSQLAGFVVDIFRFRISAENTTTTNKRHHNTLISCYRVFWDDSRNTSPQFSQLAAVHLFHGRTTHGGFNNLWRCTLDEGIHSLKKKTKFLPYASDDGSCGTQQCYRTQLLNKKSARLASAIENTDHISQGRHPWSVDR